LVKEPITHRSEVLDKYNQEILNRWVEEINRYNAKCQNYGHMWGDIETICPTCSNVKVFHMK